MIDRLASLADLLDGMGLGDDADLIDEVMRAIASSEDLNASLSHYNMGDDLDAATLPFDQDSWEEPAESTETVRHEEFQQWLDVLDTSELADYIIEMYGKADLRKLISILEESLYASK